MALRVRGAGNLARGFTGGGVFTRNDFDHSVLLKFWRQHSGNIEHLLMKISMAYGYMKYEVRRHNRYDFSQKLITQNVLGDYMKIII